MSVGSAMRGDQVTPVLHRVVEEEGGRVPPRQLEVLLDDPGRPIGREGGGEHAADEALRGLHAARAGEGIDRPVEARPVEDRAGLPLLLL